MITITRSLARHLRAVFRRAGLKPRGSLAPPVSFHAGPDGLRIRATTLDVAVEYRVPGEYPAEELTVALELLDDCQGKQDEPVTLESGKKKKTVASWRDSGIPQLIEYDAAPVKKPFPELPETLSPVNSTFWPALRDAAECTDQSPTRYALNNIQLRGESGQVFAADGRQIYMHGGFQFPWTGDVMIPALGVLGCTDLANEGSVEIGTTEQALTLRIGNWTLVLTIDSEGRFPNLEEIITRAESGASLLSLTPADAEFLAAALPRLSREDQECCGVTLDLNGRAFVRAQGAQGSPLTELALSGSTVSGEPIRVQTDRQYLLRALKLGLTELRLTSPELPMLAAGERRKYVWAPLNPEGALGPADDALRIESSSASGENPQRKTKPRRRRFKMTETATTASSANATAESQAEPATNGHAVGEAENGAVATTRRTKFRKSGRSNSATTLEQAVALRDSLRRQTSEAGDLVRAIKRQRREASLVRSTLESLKQLQAAG